MLACLKMCRTACNERLHVSLFGNSSFKIKKKLSDCLVSFLKQGNVVRAATCYIHLANIAKSKIHLNRFWIKFHQNCCISKVKDLKIFMGQISNSPQISG